MASAKVSNPQTWNRYSYGLNNPLRYIDPDGMKELDSAACASDSECVTVKLHLIVGK